VSPVAVPVVVSVALPSVALAAADTVRVDVLPVELVGLSVAVTPFGVPDTASATLPVNPPVLVMVIVEVAEAPPCVMARTAGDAERV
jgi:hypothetical protein